MSEDNSNSISYDLQQYKASSAQNTAKPVLGQGHPGSRSSINLLFAIPQLGLIPPANYQGKVISRNSQYEDKRASQI